MNISLPRKKLKEALVAIAVLKEDKQRRAEIESVRTGRARLQAIKV